MEYEQVHNYGRSMISNHKMHWHSYFYLVGSQPEMKNEQTNKRMKQQKNIE